MAYKPIMDYFPLKEARPSQRIVIEEIDRVFESGTKIVILEAPVGSGKSAIALTFAKWQSANRIKEIPEGEKETPLPVHVITPRKSLQDQYFSDFPRDLVTMKGRNSYPCILEMKPREYIPILKSVREGKIAVPGIGQQSCSGAYCEGDAEVYKLCTEHRPCPYDLAIEIAQGEDVVVHNLHSFIYQTSFATKFKKRSLLIIDEAHEIENTIRNFCTRTFNTKAEVDRSDVKKFKTTRELVDFLNQPHIMPELTAHDIQKAASDPKYVSAQAAFKAQIASLEKHNSVFDKGFSVEVIPSFRAVSNVRIGTKLEIVPHYVGHDVKRLFARLWRQGLADVWNNL